jgi:hypothetical protein
MKQKATISKVTPLMEEFTKLTNEVQSQDGESRG